MPNEGSMTFGVNSRTEINVSMAHRKTEKKDLPDCLKVLRSIVIMSGLSSICLPSTSIAAKLYGNQQGHLCIQRKPRLPLSKLALELDKTLLRHFLKKLLHSSAIPAESLADDLLVELDCLPLRDDGLLERLSNDQVRARALGVHGEVVRRAVRAADTLDPACRRLDLRVPAVLRVVRHLVAHVLAEAEARGVDADAREEEVDARDEVAERLVRDEALVDGRADRHVLDVGRARGLRVPVEQRELDVSDLGEARVRLVAGVDEVLDLGHCELPHSEQSSAG
jgi:hypothetical protein